MEITKYDVLAFGEGESEMVFCVPSTYQDDTKFDDTNYTAEEKASFYYEEHTCPTNVISVTGGEKGAGAFPINDFFIRLSDGDDDWHGMFTHIGWFTTTAKTEIELKTALREFLGIKV